MIRITLAIVRILGRFQTELTLVELFDSLIDHNPGQIITKSLGNPRPDYVPCHQFPFKVYEE